MADIHNDNPLVAEEQFGPALPIIRFSSVDEAIDHANGLDVGLGGVDAVQGVSRSVLIMPARPTSLGL